MARVVDLRVYPVKSLPPTVLTSARVLPSGALQNDRRWAFVDDTGKFWNAKRTPKLHDIGCRYDVPSSTLMFQDPESRSLTWAIGSETTAINSWFSEQMGGPARSIENTDVGFPDDLESPGPTVVSTATLETITSWFPGLTTDSVRLRLRANIEIGDVPAFWEDRLYRTEGQMQPFRIGPLTFLGINPCQRCVVPSRDQSTGEAIPQFQKLFAEKRRETLPDWAPADRFNHFYRATVNTRLHSGAGEFLTVGDTVEIL